MKPVGSVLQLAGLVLFCVGCFAVATWLGLIVAGLATVLVGVAIEKG